MPGVVMFLNTLPRSPQMDRKYCNNIIIIDDKVYCELCNPRTLCDNIDICPNGLDDNPDIDSTVNEDVIPSMDLFVETSKISYRRKNEKN